MVDDPDEAWKSSLLTLPDQVFFTLMRNYLGGITTPFNKHDLIEKLTVFMRKETIQERIISLLDEKDRLIISLVCALDSVSRENLYRITAHRFSYGSFLHLLASLQERLLLYTWGFQETLYVRINPLLKQILENRVAGFPSIFRCRTVVTPKSRVPWSEGFITALLAYVHWSPQAFESDGSLKKRAQGSFETVFPGMPGKTVKTLMEALLSLHLVYRHNERFHFRPEVYQDFLLLPEVRRKQLFGAAFVFPGAGNPDEREASRRVYHRLTTSFPDKTAVHPEDFKSYLLTCGLFEDLHRDMEEEGKNLFFLGAFQKGKDGWVSFNPGFREWMGIFDQEAAVFQANFDLLLPEHPRIQGLAFVPVLFHPVRCDRAAEFRLDQDSFVSFLDHGGTAEKAVAALSELTAHPLPPHGATTLRLWEEKYRSLSFYSGRIVRVTTDLAPFLDHSPAFQALVRETLAPGLYFLGEVSEESLREALKAAGIHHPPAPPSTVTLSSRQMPVFQVDTSSSPENPLFEAACPEIVPSRGRPPFLEDLKHSLQEKKLLQPLHKEYLHRIKRRLILDESQLSRDLDAPGQKEARGLDFPGKLRLIQEALNRTNTLLEIPLEAGSEETMILQPLTLKKQDNEEVLLALILPEGEEREFPVKRFPRIRLLSGYLVPLNG
ncbi:MAG: hypothetical protein JW760_12920 [Spirochaetales bacterium]|nr:hypothetical protein [Spirochaetales bacterium]